MAAEIQLSVILGASKGGLVIDKSASVDIDMSLARRASGSQVLSTTEEALNVGDVTTLGLMFAKNLEIAGGATIQLGIKPAGTFLPVNAWKPGEAYAVRLVPGVSYFLKASAGTPSLDIELLND